MIANWGWVWYNEGNLVAAAVVIARGKPSTRSGRPLGRTRETTLDSRETPVRRTPHPLRLLLAGWGKRLPDSRATPVGRTPHPLRLLLAGRGKRLRLHRKRQLDYSATVNKNCAFSKDARGAKETVNAITQSKPTRNQSKQGNQAIKG